MSLLVEYDTSLAGRSHERLGKLSTSHIEGEDMKTKVFNERVYRGELNKIDLINKSLEQKTLNPSRGYRGATWRFRRHLRSIGRTSALGRGSALSWALEERYEVGSKL